MQIGRKIFTLRTEKGLTQKQLAELLFVSPSAVSKWEQDKAMPDLYKLLELAEIFQVSAAIFFEEPETEVLYHGDKNYEALYLENKNYEALKLGYENYGVSNLEDKKHGAQKQEAENIHEIGIEGVRAKVVKKISGKLADSFMKVERKLFRKSIIIPAGAIFTLILAAGCLFGNQVFARNEYPSYEIVDEYWDTSGYLGYDHVYHVAVEYAGEMGSEHQQACERIVYASTWNRVRDQADYVCVRFDNHYEGRHQDTCSGFVFFPTVDFEDEAGKTSEKQ